MIHDGVDTDMFLPREDVSPEPNSVLFVGNSEDRNKGIRYLLQALRLLRSRVPFHLTVVHRPASHQAPRLARKLGLHGRVTFLQGLSTEELVRQYNRAHLLVSPSLYEGFGLPPLEAMAHGAPVLASNVSALPEVLGEAALYVNPENVFDISRGIRSLLLDKKLRKQLVKRGHAQVEKFSWKESVRRVLEVYRAAAGAEAS
ncbi:MAG: glycosyltransferase family 4 protein [Acidobacteria bacterium]|nr:glycosyltransferase family 4 protein [Acidobacteriota bacterium]